VKTQIVHDGAAIVVFAQVVTFKQRSVHARIVA
jgi:hypothetical protein